MNKFKSINKFKLILSWIIIIFWLALIFNFSAQPVYKSNGLSKKVTEVVIKLLSNI